MEKERSCEQMKRGNRIDQTAGDEETDEEMQLNEYCTVHRGKIPCLGPELVVSLARVDVGPMEHICSQTRFPTYTLLRHPERHSSHRQGPTACGTSQAMSSAQPEPQPTITAAKDCLPCRLTGAATFGGVGTYALYLAHQDGAFSKIRRKGGSIVGSRLQVVLGVTFIGLGLGRLVV
jgi:hypothetical protein